MKNKVLIVAIIVIGLLSQISIYSDDLRALAVLDVIGDGRLPAADIRLISSQLIDTVSRLAKDDYRLIAIGKRNEIIREIEFALSAASDQGQYKKIGNLLSADLILSAKVGSKNPGYYFDASLLSVETSEILANSLKHVDSFSDLLQKAIPGAVCDVLSLHCDVTFAATEKPTLAQDKRMQGISKKSVSIADPTTAIGISNLGISEIKQKLTDDSLISIVQDNDITYIIIQGAFKDEFLNKEYKVNQIAFILPYVSVGITSDILWNAAMETKENGVVFIRTFGPWPRTFYGLLNRVDMNIDDKLFSFTGVTKTMRASSGYMTEIKYLVNSEILRKIREANKVMVRIYLGNRPDADGLGNKPKADVHVTIKLVQECLAIF